MLHSPDTFKLLWIILEQITPSRLEIITHISPTRAKIHKIALGITSRIVIRVIPKWRFEGDNTPLRVGCTLWLDSLLIHTLCGWLICFDSQRLGPSIMSHKWTTCFISTVFENLWVCLKTTCVLFHFMDIEVKAEVKSLDLGIRQSGITSIIIRINKVY